MAAGACEKFRRRPAAPNGKATLEASDVPKLTYIECVFREALRLYSPVVELTRDAAHDTVLAGHRIFQGERVSVLTRALHTNPPASDE